MRDILEECWNYAQDSFKEHNDYEEESIEDLQNRIEELEDMLNDIHSLSSTLWADTFTTLFDYLGIDDE